MSTFLQQLINGISLGAIYALIALGYTMVYGILRLINFAHGDVYMVGAFMGYYLAGGIGIRGAQMLMGIAFDANGTLYATTFRSESELYRVDLTSGAATLVGRTGQSFVHSAEFERRRR